ncbi:MAG: hypothetical protein JOY58_05605 [Solirubrobacterales bacterium]|nr:hypothetical protein [Solirubrobacterales bacterium]
MLTVDADGFPHVCLLSRAELEAGVSEIRGVIASQTTSANLKRSRRATLMVIDPAAAWYCKLEVLGLRVKTANRWRQSFMSRPSSGTPWMLR